MKKVKISQEEKRFIDKLNLHYGRTAFAEYLSVKDEIISLEDFTLEEISLIFNGWYEVVDTYEVGDYVYDLPNDTYHKITEVFSNDTVSFEPLEGAFNLSYSSNEKPFTKVTEPWKIKLLELGRKRPEFKSGDKISAYVNGFVDCSTVSEMNIEIIEEMARDSNIEYLYPVESRIPFSLT